MTEIDPPFDLDSSPDGNSLRLGYLVQELCFRMQLLWFCPSCQEYPSSDIPWERLKQELRALKSEFLDQARMDNEVERCRSNWESMFDSEMHHDSLWEASQTACQTRIAGGHEDDHVHSAFVESLSPVTLTGLGIKDFCLGQMEPRQHHLFGLGEMYARLRYPEQVVDYLDTSVPQADDESDADSCGTASATHGGTHQTTWSTSGTADAGQPLFLPRLPLNPVPSPEKTSIRQSIDTRLSELGISKSFFEVQSLMPEGNAVVQSYLGVAVDIENGTVSREGFENTVSLVNQNARLLQYFVSQRENRTTTGQLESIWGQFGGRAKHRVSSGTVSSQISDLNTQIESLGVKVVPQRNLGRRLEPVN